MNLEYGASFKFTLNNTILPGCVTVGLYDGKHPTLTCGTTGGKVLMHNPHKVNVNNNGFGDNNMGQQQSASNEDKITFLNINNQITAVACAENLYLSIFILYWVAK